MSLNIKELLSNDSALNEIHEKAKRNLEKLKIKNKTYVKAQMQNRAQCINKPYPIEQMNKNKSRISALIFLISISTWANGIKIKTLNYYKNNNSKPKIFVPTHVGKYDIQITYQCIKEHALLLSGTEHILHNSLNGWFLKMCGVNFLNRNDKQDRVNCLKKMEQDLLNNFNILWFPEGTWNIDKSLLVCPISYSVINLAIKTGAQIVPIGIERYDNTFYINFAESYNPDKNKSPIENANVLRDILATLKWEIIEQMPITKRNTIAIDHWSKIIMKYVKEFPITDLIEEDSFIFKPKGDAYDFFEEFNSRTRFLNGKACTERITSESKHKFIR